MKNSPNEYDHHAITFLPIKKNVLSTVGLLYKVTIKYSCPSNETQNPDSVSQKVWHYKDPSLLQGQKCWAKAKSLQPFTGNGGPSN